MGKEIVTLQQAVDRAIQNAGGVRALARLVHLSHGYISDLRNGKIIHPTIYVCRKLGIVRDADYCLRDKAKTNQDRGE